jgi:hypothetical protein
MSTPKMPDLNDGGQRTLEAVRHLVGTHGERLDGHQGRLDGHEATLGEHHDRISALEKAATASGRDGDNGDN